MLKMGWMLNAERHHRLLAAIVAWAAIRGAKVLVTTPSYEGDVASMEAVLAEAGALEGTIRQEPWVDQSMVRVAV